MGNETSLIAPDGKHIQATVTFQPISAHPLLPLPAGKPLQKKLVVLRNAMIRLQNLYRLRRSLKRQHPDLVFFACLDDMLPTLAPLWLFNLLLPYQWSGLLVQSALPPYQPRIVNEVHATMIDLNSVSDYIMSFQRQRKPLRIFYTKASSINKAEHMNDVLRIYEKLNFSGLPIGFATEGILKNNPHEWDAIVVYKTPYAFKSDIETVQKYLDECGTVIIDNESFKTDEYGRKIDLTLKQGKGKLIVVSTLNEMKNEALAAVKSNKGMPMISIAETNDRNMPGCEWRVIAKDKNKYIVNIVNIGKSDATVSMSAAKGNIKSVSEVLTGLKSATKIVLKPNDVQLLEVSLE